MRFGEPNLYTVIARLQRRNESYDDLYVNVGVRSYTITPDGGFSINGVPDVYKRQIHG